MPRFTELRPAGGSQFLLPTEDSAEVAAALAERFGLPSWQFTLSATQANRRLSKDRGRESDSVEITRSGGAGTTPR
jgi:hypothetical protein